MILSDGLIISNNSQQCSLVPLSLYTINAYSAKRYCEHRIIIKHNFVGVSKLYACMVAGTLVA
jgi:archaellum component FlaF (FlaF/FlaG flagellin family)